MLSRYNRNPSPQVPGELDAVPAGGTSSIIGDRIQEKPDYLAMLAANFGLVAQTQARMLNLMELAKERGATKLITGLNFNATIAVPDGNMMSMVLARPTASELTTPFPYNLQLQFDDGVSYQIPIKGMCVIALASHAKTFQVTSPDATTAAATTPGNWALYLRFTNREIQPGLNL